MVSEYDVIIAEPTLATGVSVDLKGDNTCVYGIFQAAIAATRFSSRSLACGLCERATSGCGGGEST